jgi:hypothetical protein
MQTSPPTAGARLVYSRLHTGDVFIIDTCQNLIRAIESRVHDKNRVDKNRLRLRKWSAIPTTTYGTHGAKLCTLTTNPKGNPLQKRVRDRLNDIRRGDVDSLEV